MLMEYTVLMTFQYPAWDERDGIPFTVTAGSRREAVRAARRAATRDGHAIPGRGAYWFRVVEAKPALS